MINWPKREESYPLAPLRDTVIFPSTISGLAFGRDSSVSAVKAAGEGGYMVVAAQKDPIVTKPGLDELHSVGTLGIIHQVMEADNGLNVLFEGIARVRIRRTIQEEPYWKIGINRMGDSSRITGDVRIRRDAVINQFKRLINEGKDMPLETIIKVLAIENPHELVSVITPQLSVETGTMQEILEIEDVEERLDMLIGLLIKEYNLLTRKGGEIEAKVELTKTEKDIFLREETRSLQGEMNDRKDSDLEELRKQIAAANMPEEVRAKAEREFSRLAQMSNLSPEVSYIRTYLDWLISLPWNTKSGEEIDIYAAQETLDAEHYGLAQIKDRILEYIAVQKLAGKMKGSILCFIGPPGTGKTSIGRSIAKALGRKFTKVSLGGIKDEAEIRGHRRTYVGAMPGRIIQGIVAAGTRDPVFVLDEIDKVGMDFRGDPSAALLEALDPEQNNAFSDHYLEVSFDLSDTIFITTANTADTIPPALLDRMELIEFSGYSPDEKLQIAKQHLVRKIRESHGLADRRWDISEEALGSIISEYTKEAGVRSLEREISKIARKVARRIVEDDVADIAVDKANLRHYLGPSKLTSWWQQNEEGVGLSIALAWTEAGGEVLPVEVDLINDGQYGVTLTGQMGDVMKESAQTALSFARHYVTRIGREVPKDLSVHIHMPSGAIPKDGPSAGLAMAGALVSALLAQPPRNSVALSGEITLQGRLMRVGGVKEKVLAAHRAGVREIILPEENRFDIDDIPPEVSHDITISFVRKADEAVESILPSSKEKSMTVGC